MEQNITPTAYLAASESQFRAEVLTKPGIGFSSNDPIMQRIHAGADAA